MNALVTVPQNNVEIYRASTDAASLCKEIVVASAMEIDRRKYVKVEGWQAIAIAHGCTGSARDVERVPGGVRAIGEVRRMSDGAVIAEAEGFVGEDEATWFGGEVEVNEWISGRKTGRRIKKTLQKRPDYAIRAMAQTRAISRACRSAFAHVVVMMNAGLSTTPAEEVPDGGFQDADYHEAPPRSEPSRTQDRDQAPPVEDKPKASPQTVLDGAKVAIDMCGSEAAIDQMLADRAEGLRNIKRDMPAIHDQIIHYAREKQREMREASAGRVRNSSDAFSISEEEIPF